MKHCRLRCKQCLCLNSFHLYVACSELWTDDCHESKCHRFHDFSLIVADQQFHTTLLDNFYSWFFLFLSFLFGFRYSDELKNLPSIQEAQVQSLGWEDPLEEEMATHSGILARKILWTEEPDGLQSMGHKDSDTTKWLTDLATRFLWYVCLDVAYSSKVTRSSALLGLQDNHGSFGLNYC